jgi:hypothetical protein
LLVDHSPADELFDLDPGAFVAARDRVAKQLKADGDGDVAASVKALRRPSVGAWAVNQVARRQPDLVAAVVDAGRALAAALDAGDRAGLRLATRARRDAVRAATRAAVDLAGETHRDEIANTFEAVVGDEEAAAEVIAGRLTRGRSPSAVFSPLGEVALDEPDDATPPAAHSRSPSDAAALAAAEARVDAAQRAVTAGRRALDEAEAGAEAAVAELERLRRPSADLR